MYKSPQNQGNYNSTKFKTKRKAESMNKSHKFLHLHLSMFELECMQVCIN